jgi:Predicted hydrolases or acyltransferases (alpha/beta hydrolase superfamily)
MITNLFLSATIGLFLTVATMAQKVGDIKTVPYTFVTNNGQKVEAELGSLYVPERHGKPNGKLIELAFVRFKSTAKISSFPIVYLAGGPGGSGISLAKGARFPLFMAMHEIGDVIALDQRGTGLSKPNLACQEKLNYPLDRPTEKAKAIQLYRDKSKSCAQFWLKQGVDLTAYNTNENADDLDVLRKALGVEKITLWGSSYGTHLGLAFIRRHEKNVYRAVFSGVEGMDDTFKLPGTLDAQLKLVSDLVKHDANLREKIPDLTDLVKRVFGKLENTPVQVETKDGKITLGKFDLQQLAIALLGDREGKEVLPAVFYDFDKGAWDSPYVKYFSQFIAQQRRGELGSPMAFAMDCASFASTQRLDRINRESKTSLLGDSLDFPFPDVCTAWGNLKLDDSFRRPVRSNVKVLFLSGTFDGRTPPGNVQELLKGFPNGQHVLIEGAGHGNELFISSPQIKDVMIEFMRDRPLSTKTITLPPIKFQSIR